MHAAGEFTAARTKDGQLDIQARMVPIDDWVSVNSAVAARVGAHRVTIDADRDHMVYLDGQPLQLDEFDEHPLDGGGAIIRQGIGVRVQWPDSETTLSTWLRAGIDYRVQLAPEHLEQITGLHGDHDGQRWFADGRSLPARPSHDELHAYGDSWRVTDATSLFDYADGATTATYTDRNFPSTAPSLELLDADRRAWATTICQAAGLTGFYLEACVVDLALTGDTRFVTSAVSAQVDVAPEAFDHSAANAAYPAGLSTVAPEVVWATDAGNNLIVEPGEELVVGAGIVVTQQGAGPGSDFDVSLQAWDLADGSLRWEADGFHRCQPVIVEDTVVALAADDDGTLVALDPHTGDVVAEATLASWSGGCVLGQSTTSTGLVLAPRQVVGSRTPMSQLRAFDVANDMAQAWSRDFDGDVLGYAATADDRIYVLDRRDGRSVEVQRLDPTSGVTAASIELPITSTASTREGALVALPDGGAAVLGQRAGGDDVLVVLDDRGADLEVAWEFVFGGDTGLNNRFPRLRAVGDLLVGWSGDVVGALDRRDGSVRWIHTPTSFENNRGAIAAFPSGVVIGPFGGAVMEVIGLDGAELSSLDTLGDVEHLRQIGPVVDDQLIVRFSFRGRETSIALVSLGG